MKIEDIDNLILDTFIYNKNSIDNANKISHETDIDNLVQGLYNHSLYLKNEKKKEILEKLLEYSEISMPLRHSLNKNKILFFIKQTFFFLEEISKSRLEIEKLLEEKLKDKEKTKQMIIAVVSIKFPYETFKFFIETYNSSIKDFNNKEIEEIKNIINKTQSEDSKIWFENFFIKSDH